MNLLIVASLLSCAIADTRLYVPNAGQSNNQGPKSGTNFDDREDANILQTPAVDEYRHTKSGAGFISTGERAGFGLSARRGTKHVLSPTGNRYESNLEDATHFESTGEAGFQPSNGEPTNYVLVPAEHKYKLTAGKAREGARFEKLASEGTNIISAPEEDEYEPIVEEAAGFSTKREEAGSGLSAEGDANFVTVPAEGEYERPVESAASFESNGKEAELLLSAGSARSLSALVRDVYRTLAGDTTGFGFGSSAGENTGFGSARGNTEFGSAGGNTGFGSAGVNTGFVSAASTGSVGPVAPTGNIYESNLESATHLESTGEVEFQPSNGEPTNFVSVPAEHKYKLTAGKDARFGTAREGARFGQSAREGTNIISAPAEDEYEPIVEGAAGFYTKREEAGSGLSAEGDANFVTVPAEDEYERPVESAASFESNGKKAELLLSAGSARSVSASVRDVYRTPAGDTTRFGFGSSTGGNTRFGSATSTGYVRPVACGPGEELNALGVCVEAVFTRNTFVFSGPPVMVAPGPPPQIPPPKINYDVTFVHTPDQPDQPDPIVIPPPQERSLIYVLTKNEQAVQQVIEVPAAPGQEPEVFYINYDEGDNPTVAGGLTLQDILLQAGLQGQGIGGGFYDGLGGGGSAEFEGSVTGGAGSDRAGGVRTGSYQPLY